MSATWDRLEGSRRASVMAPHQDILSFIHAGGQIRRPAKIWMKLFNQIAMSPRNVGGGRSLLQTEDLVGFILGDRARTGRSRLAGAPRVAVRISCRTPSGKPAVQIRL